ncbi:DUF1353 domain-containing protein [Hahella ganghwensis]|uniref:DUF1353 domain-containing protein n=1 Tax=Hahella ganghwensis TaxID=286420 RepID=UPI000683DFE7|nr:DUF1353 domain-containing protein [Hahella ganghwensis]
MMTKDYGFNRESDELDQSSIRGAASWMLKENLIWTCRDGYKITVKKGFRHDLASIPATARWLVSNDDFRVRRAAILHDFLYSIRGHLANKNLSRAKCDSLFYEALRFDGVSRLKSGLMYLGVRAGGWFAWDCQL